VKPGTRHKAILLQDSYFRDIRCFSFSTTDNDLLTILENNLWNKINVVSVICTYFVGVHRFRVHRSLRAGGRVTFLSPAL
jgi:hypothetical protein